MEHDGRLAVGPPALFPVDVVALTDVEAAVVEGLDLGEQVRVGLRCVHSSQRNQRAARSGMPTAHAISVTSAPTETELVESA